MRYSMIMAGGAGTRLWPLSRRSRPKQLLPMVERDGKDISLIALSDARLDGLIDPDRRYVCTGERYRAAVLDAIRELEDERLLGEPAARDTVNAVGLTAAVLAQRDPDAVFCILTADHVITPEDRFRARLERGFELVERDPSKIVTFSIKPTYAATGFGYVERDQPIGDDGLAFDVTRFVEKPDEGTARLYLEKGTFGWNSGMFVLHAATFLERLEGYLPEAHAGVMEIGRAWDTPERAEVLGRIYPALPKISVDFAVMEPAARDGHVATVTMDIDWLDVGSWPSLAQTRTPDFNNNRVAGPGSVLLENCHDTLVYSGVPGRTVTVLGVDGLVVVETEDATLVMPAAQAERLKTLHARVEDTLK
ncbi:MAG: mannose-1-phosphate guanylyltransferase [Planctomycetota bacterium]